MRNSEGPVAHRHISLSIVAVGLAAIAMPVFAADFPVKAPQTASASGFYIWADGSYQSIGLPTYDLGVRLLPVAAGSSISAANTYDPRATGYGVSGGVGFVLPPGIFLSNVGTNARLEFSGSYVNAKASQAESTTSTPGSGYAVPQLSGLTMFASSNACGAGNVCVVSSTLGTTYSSWQVSGRYATDFKANGVTFTPSLAVFGGKSRNDQTLSQTNLFSTGTNVRYNADTKLDWTDWGGRAGLSGSVPVTDWLTFVAGGNAGLAVRRVSLTGSDSANAYNAGGAPLFATSYSSVAASQTTTAFVANVEASVIVRLARNWALRAFGGLNYDNKVPGISAPGVFMPFGSGGSSTAADITYQAETSYYTGGGLTVKF